jgi:predicted proteasome-type protease
MYGPYDNGHILVGLSTGDFFAFDSLNLQKLFNIKLSDCPITQITIEPTQLVLVAVSQTQEITAINFIQTKTQYIYLEIGTRKYATVVIDKDNRAK